MCDEHIFNKWKTFCFTHTVTLDATCRYLLLHYGNGYMLESHRIMLMFRQRISDANRFVNLLDFVMWNSNKNYECPCSVHFAFSLSSHSYLSQSDCVSEWVSVFAFVMSRALANTTTNEPSAMRPVLCTLLCQTAVKWFLFCFVFAAAAAVVLLLPPIFEFLLPLSIHPLFVNYREFCCSLSHFARLDDSITKYNLLT